MEFADKRSEVEKCQICWAGARLFSLASMQLQLNDGREEVGSVI